MALHAGDYTRVYIQRWLFNTLEARFFRPGLRPVQGASEASRCVVMRTRFRSRNSSSGACQIQERKAADAATNDTATDIRGSARCAFRICEEVYTHRRPYNTFQYRFRNFISRIVFTYSRIVA